MISLSLPPQKARLFHPSPFPPLPFPPLRPPSSFAEAHTISFTNLVALRSNTHMAYMYRTAPPRRSRSEQLSPLNEVRIDDVSFDDGGDGYKVCVATYKGYNAYEQQHSPRSAPPSASHRAPHSAHSSRNASRESFGGPIPQSSTTEQLEDS